MFIQTLIAIDNFINHIAVSFFCFDSKIYPEDDTYAYHIRMNLAEYSDLVHAVLFWDVSKYSVVTMWQP